MPRILIVEDNVDLARGIGHNLRREGHEVEVAANGSESLELARDFRPDLLILDLMLPEMNGFEVLETLRAQGSRIPVLVLTARGEETDKVRAFRLDADQYMTKPFGLMELLERVKVLLRREAEHMGRQASPDVVCFGDVEVDRAARRVTKGSEEVLLRPKEFDLLVALVDREGEVMSRHDLLRDVWGHLGSVQTRTVDWHVSELRRKLEDDPPRTRHIHTVRKAGYRFER